MQNKFIELTDQIKLGNKEEAREKLMKLLKR